MTFDADALLVGPRGRRLCLAYASAVARGAGFLEPETPGAAAFLEALMWSAHRLNAAQGPGAFAVGFTFGRAWWPPSGWAGRKSRARKLGLDDVPQFGVADVAQALGDLPLAPPDIETVMDALDECVAFAWYWQPPDGDDILAADPRMWDGLLRMATILVGSPLTDWWDTGCVLDDQWHLVRRWREESDREPWAGGDMSLAQWRQGELDQEREAARHFARKPNDPCHYAWWTLPGWVGTGTTRSLGELGPVGLRLLEDGSGWDEAVATRVTVSPRARVYEVDGPDAWTRLVARYPLDVTHSRRTDWWDATGRLGAWLIPDFEAVACDWDGVHVSVAGYLTAAGRALSVTDAAATVLAGWNPDETRWFVPLEEDASTRQNWWHPPGEGLWVSGESWRLR